MADISAAVGRGGTNKKDDVKTIQTLLNNADYDGKPSPLDEDGLIGPATIGAIETFQKNAVGMKRPDGRIDPGGKTFRILEERQAPKSEPESSDQTRDTPVAPAPAAQSGDLAFSAKGTALLQEIETLALEPYDDQTGDQISSWVEGATIGYGHLIAKSEWNTYKNGIDKAGADALFQKDLAPFVNTVNDGIDVPLSQNQFDALVILVFNIGANGFKNSSVRKLVNDPNAQTNYDSLEAAWKAWNKSQGKVMQGLVNRRESEWNIYSKNVYKRW